MEFQWLGNIRVCSVHPTEDGNKWTRCLSSLVDQTGFAVDVETRSYVRMESASCHPDERTAKTGVGTF